MHKAQLVAVDTNIVLALGGRDDDTVDALELILGKLSPAQFILCPTVLQETSYLAANGDTEEKRKLAREGLQEAVLRRFHPSPLNAAERAIADNAAREILARTSLPAGENNDARILAEASVLNCVLLVSRDSHLLALDHFGLNLVLRELDLNAPVIATPKDLIRLYYR